MKNLATEDTEVTEKNRTMNVARPFLHSSVLSVLSVANALLL